MDDISTAMHKGSIEEQCVVLGKEEGALVMKASRKLPKLSDPGHVKF